MKTKPVGNLRIWQIDALRGIAIAFMIIYHVFYDLDFLGYAHFDLASPPFIFFQRTIAVLFLALVGYSLAISKPSFGKAAKRAAFLGLVALVITGATMIYPGRGAIVFGIIHLIAVSVLLGYFFLPLGMWNVLSSAAVFLAWFFTNGSIAGSPFLVWLGFPPASFYALDYYPLLPWFSLVLLGIGLERLIRFKPGKTPDNSPIPQLAFLGRNSLAIYLLHQPMLILVISALSGCSIHL